MIGLTTVGRTAPLSSSRLGYRWEMLMRQGAPAPRLDRLWAFVTAMDARAWRTLAVSFVLFGGVGLIFVGGAKWLGLSDPAALRAWFAAAPGSLALPAVVGAFAVLAFAGAPQFVLIAAAVLAFGPTLGFAYSWLGTMVSALVGFWLGRRFGARALADLRGEGLRRFMALIGDNGFAASLIVRLVPFAPFVLVNMTAGATPMRALDFTFGTALGILPKIALTAFAGSQVMRALHGGAPEGLVWLAVAVAAWLSVGLAARRWLNRRGAAGR